MSSQEDAAEEPGRVGPPLAHPGAHVGGHAQLKQPNPLNMGAPILVPGALKVLVVDSKGSSRTAVCSLLRDCEYQVTSVKSSAEALHFLLTGQQPGAGEQSGGAGQQLGLAQEAQNIDLVIKEHEPPDADAGRLLKKMARSELLRKIPVVVMSSQDEREVVMNCLTLGAIDYLVKPLRHNELRHIWTRVWWWRRSGLGAPAPLLHTPRALRTHELSYHSSESKETKCDDEEEPTSKEGSAPDANNGSNGNGHGSNGHGSKDGNGTSRVDAKPHDNGNGNGSSDNKNGHHGSNGNGASTTLAVERNGAHPLAHTAEGRAPQGYAALDSQVVAKVATGRSVLFPGEVYAQTPLASASRKRPFNQAVDPGQTPNASAMRDGNGHQVVAAGEPIPKVSKGGAGHRDRHDREARAGATASMERHERLEREGRGSGGTAAPERGAGTEHRPARAPSAGHLGATTGGHSGAPSGSRGTAAAAATGSQPASKPHGSHDTNAPSQRAQVLHTSGFGGVRGGEGGTSVSGLVAHGSGNASRTARGTTGGSSGADATGTISVAHFAPHHLQASLPNSLAHMPSWGSLAPPTTSAHVPGAGAGSQTGGFPPLFPPFGLPPHILAPPLHSLSLYAPSPAVSGPGSELHGINPVIAANNFLQAMQLNQTLAAQQQGMQDGTLGSSQVEGCSSAIGSRGPVRGGSSSQGVDTGFTPPGHQQLLMQYIQAFAQLNSTPGLSNAGLSGSVNGGGAGSAPPPLGPGGPPGTLPAAQAALAAAWAAGGPAGLFPPPQPPPHTHHHAHLRHPHHPHPHSSASHAGHASLAALPPSAIQLAMQLMPGMAGPPPPSPNTLAAAVGAARPLMPPTALTPPLVGGLLPPPGAGSMPTDAVAAAAAAARAAAAMDPATRQAMLLSMGPMGPLLMAGLPGLGLPGAGLPAPGAVNLAALGAVRPPLVGSMAAVPVVGPVVSLAEPSTRRRRAMALDKYRQKRKNLKFSSAIRYENRKAQAQARPRIKGQFAKATQQVNDGGAGGEAAEGSNACGDQEENDEDMPTAMPGQDEDEEYDHGVDDDEMDHDDEEGDADPMEGAGASTGQRANAAAGTNGPLSGPRKRQRSSNALSQQPNGPGSDAGGNGGGKRWVSRHRGRGGGARQVSGLGPGGDRCGPTHSPMVADAGGTPMGHQGGHRVQCEEEEEEDVADSLRELKEGRRTSPSAIKTELHVHRHHRHGAASGGDGCKAAAHLLSASRAVGPVGPSVDSGQQGAAQHGQGAGQGAVQHGQGGEGQGAGGHPPCTGPQTSLSLGSQSGLAVSKGSHGRTSQHRGGAPTRAASGLPVGVASQNDQGGGRGDSMGGGYGTATTRGGDGEPGGTGSGGNPGAGLQRVSNHGRDAAAGARALTSHNDGHTGSNQNNCKNGSDSGSNSPDENGNGGGAEQQQQPRGSGHGGHSKSHRHDNGGGGSARRE